MKTKKIEIIFIVFFCFFSSLCPETQGSNGEWEILNPYHHRITSIKVSSGCYVDSIELFAHDPEKNQTYSLGKKGGSGGKVETINFSVNEKLLKIFGKQGCCVDSINFVTNVKPYGPYGGSGGVRDFEYVGDISGLRGYQGWFFVHVIKDIGIITLPYEVNAVIENFQYNLHNLQDDIIKQHTKPVDLMESRTIINESNTEMTDTLTYAKTFTNTFSFGFKESLNFAASATFNTILPCIDLQINTSVNLEANQQATQTKTVTYTMQKQVRVPPWESVRISSYVNWIKNLEFPFTADVKITALERGTNRSIDGNLVEQILAKSNFKGRVIKIEEDAVFASISGNLVGSYGLDSVFSSTKIDKQGNILPRPPQGQ